MNKLYVTRDEGGAFAESTVESKDWGDGSWDIKQSDLDEGNGFLFGTSVHYGKSLKELPRQKDYNALMALKYPFIKPGEQWMRKSLEGRGGIEAHYVSGGKAVQYYYWTRIATLDDKMDVEVVTLDDEDWFWASMDESGRWDLWEQRTKLSWERGTTWESSILDTLGYRFRKPDGLQPGMLCKVRKEGDGYKIIACDEECECHLPIENVQWRFISTEPRVLGKDDDSPMCGEFYPRFYIEKQGWDIERFKPYLHIPESQKLIQITCKFKEKEKERWHHCYQHGIMAFSARYNYCPYCGKKL